MRAGIVVKHQMGRPIKVEGNPQHPASLGATDVFAQAEVLDFYDPDRGAAITAHGLPADRQRLQTALADAARRNGRGHGAGFRILTGTMTSPTLARSSMRCCSSIRRRAGTNGSRYPAITFCRRDARLRYACRVRAEPGSR